MSFSRLYDINLISIPIVIWLSLGFWIFQIINFSILQIGIVWAKKNVIGQRCSFFIQIQITYTQMSESESESNRNFFKQNNRRKWWPNQFLNLKNYQIKCNFREIRWIWKYKCKFYISFFFFFAAGTHSFDSSQTVDVFFIFTRLPVRVCWELSLCAHNTYPDVHMSEMFVRLYLCWKPLIVDFFCSQNISE